MASSAARTFADDCYCAGLRTPAAAGATALAKTAHGAVGAVVACVVLFAAGASRAAMLTNFAGSYALYQQCAMDAADFNLDGVIDGADFMTWQRGVGLGGQTSNANGDANQDGVVNVLDLVQWNGKFGTSSGNSDSFCFKLYFDPEGIAEGDVTAVVDAPADGPFRFELGNENGVVDRHPQYSVNILQTQISAPPGRQRIEARINFQALNPLDPPAGPITIFGYQVHDNQPQLGMAGVAAGFEFRPGNFIRVFNPANGQTTIFDDTQLPDVPLQFVQPLLLPGDAILAIDIDEPSSSSNYPGGDGPGNAVDGNPGSKYANLAKRNTGVIVSVPQASSGNLLANPSFEAPITQDGPPFEGSWEGFASGPTAFVNNEVTMPLSGGQHLIAAINNTPNAFAGVLQDVPGLAPGTGLELAGFHKIGQTPFDAQVEVRIEWRNSLSNTEVGRTPNLTPVPQNDYTSFSMGGVVPAGADVARVVYALQTFNPGMANNGAVFVDDMSLSGPGGPPVVRSMVLVTAPDGTTAGDPASWELYGTNDPVASGDNSDGMGGENWQLISSGSTGLPDERGAAGPVLSFPNSTPYASYRIVFPDIRDFRAASAMQLGDIGLFSSLDGSGSNLLSSSFGALAFQLPTPQADSPPDEGPINVHDGDPALKYRNFGKENSGFIVTPQGGATIVSGFTITTADDQPDRDPASWALYGTNDPITSGNFSQGASENWTLIDSGVLALPNGRLTMGAFEPVIGTTSYKSYRMVFPTLKNTLGPDADSVQIGEIQFFGFKTGAPAAGVPEPASLVMLGGCLSGISATRASRKRRLL